MRLYLVVVLIALVCLMELCESRGRGGSRGSGGSKSRSRSSKNRNKSGGGGSASKPRITKYTPITPTSRKTAVIASQTTRRSMSFRNVLFGYMAYRYMLGNAPVYRYGYPMYRRSFVIPEERAVRIMSSETKMLDNNGSLCLNGTEQSKKQLTIQEGADKNVIQVNTTIQYDDEKPEEFYGINQNFTLREQEGVDFKIVSRTEYNTTLVVGKNCFVVEERVEGTVIHLYETNPDGASAVAVNMWLSLMTVLIVAFGVGEAGVYNCPL